MKRAIQAIKRGPQPATLTDKIVHCVMFAMTGTATVLLIIAVMK